MYLNLFFFANYLNIKKSKFKLIFKKHFISTSNKNEKTETVILIIFCTKISYK